MNEDSDDDVEDTHPRHLYEHEHHDRIAGLNCVGWIKEWYKWAFKEAYDKYFTTSGQGLLEPEEDQGNGIKDKSDPQVSVWFLAFPMYSYTTNGPVQKYVNLPTGKWHFLAPVYNAHPSKEMYPSIRTNDELFGLAKSDVDDVYYLEVNLDGYNLAGCRVPIKKPFEIKISKNNAFGLASAELGEGNSMNIVSDGYWIWIKELPPGDHILRLKGYSRRYKLDVEFNLYVRGPGRNR